MSTHNLEAVDNEIEFYNKIAEDSKSVLIQLISEASHGKTSSLRTIIEHCRRLYPEIVFKIFDISFAWFHCAPVKYRQFITINKIERNQLENIPDCVYEIGSLSEWERRAFVGAIIKEDYDARYMARLSGDDLSRHPTIAYVFEEANIYFGSYSFRKNDDYSQVFQQYVSVGRNYKLRGFLVATAEVGEMAPSLRERSRKIYGRVTSERDLGVIRRKNKELALYLTQIPRFSFVYLSDKPYGPIRIPDIVKTVPQDYNVKGLVDGPEPRVLGRRTLFAVGVGVGFALWYVLYLLVRILMML